MDSAPSKNPLHWHNHSWSRHSQSRSRAKCTLCFFQATRCPRANRDAKTSQNRRWEDSDRVLRICCSPIASRAVACPLASRSSPARTTAFSERPVFFFGRAAGTVRRLLLLDFPAAVGAAQLATKSSHRSFCTAGACHQIPPKSH
jgi:hypothetical protein